MPNKPSAKKALRQSIKRKALNDQRKDTYRQVIKDALKIANQDDKLKLARQAQKALDKAAQKGVIKKNMAARKLSRLMKKVNAASKLEKKEK